MNETNISGWIIIIPNRTVETRPVSVWFSDTKPVSNWFLETKWNDVEFVMKEHACAHTLGAYMALYHKTHCAVHPH